jgi:hypothetical protein
MRGVLNDAVSLYFADATLASAFVARWCILPAEFIQHAIWVYLRFTFTRAVETGQSAKRHPLPLQ